MRRSHKSVRVLLVYHGAALEPSRKIFEALAAHKEIRLRVLGPRKGYNRLRDLVLDIPKPYHGTYDLVTGCVHEAMRDFSGPYLTGLLREMVRFRPHVIHVFNEAYSLVNVQTLFYKDVFLRRAKCFCLGVENIITRSASTRGEQFKRRYVHQSCDGVACWSTSAQDALREAGFPEDKLRITYWGVPLTQFRPNRNDTLRADLGISGKFVIGYVGRLRPEKGLLTLLSALRLLPSSVHFLCLGDGDWRETLNSKVNEFQLADRFHWVPRVEDGRVPAYMNAMDVLVLPSETTPRWKEQFGRVLPEAMACGLPIISSDSGAIPEIVGDAGLIFTERDYTALAGCISKVTASAVLRRRLSSAGLRRASTHFSCEALARRLIDMYSAVAPRKLEQVRELSS